MLSDAGRMCCNYKTLNGERGAALQCSLLDILSFIEGIPPQARSGRPDRTVASW